MLEECDLRLLGTNEELRAVSVRTGVGHGDHPSSGVAELEVLVLEVVSVHGPAPGPVPCSDVPALHHELRNDAVEDGALQTEPSLSGTKTSEVLRSSGSRYHQKLPSSQFIVPRDDVESQLYHHLPHVNTVQSDLEEDLDVSSVETRSELVEPGYVLQGDVELSEHLQVNVLRLPAHPPGGCVLTEEINIEILLELASPCSPS